jgi:hypothetical protein
VYAVAWDLTASIILMAERHTAVAVEQANDLPSLVERLARDVTSLLDQKLALLKIEVKEDVSAYLRGSVAIAGGAIVGAVGFALVNVALAFAVSTLFANTDFSQPARYALAFY